MKEISLRLCGDASNCLTDVLLRTLAPMIRRLTPFRIISRARFFSPSPLPANSRLQKLTMSGCAEVLTTTGIAFVISVTSDRSRGCYKPSVSGGQVTGEAGFC